MVDIGKARLRAEAVEARRALTPEQHAATAAALVQALRPLATGRVAAYASVGTEPSTHLLLGELDDVVLPLLLPDGDLDWAAYEGELVPGPRGLLQPPGPRLGRDAVAGCGLVLVPALRVAGDGTRLGRGGGSYDRVLGRARGLVVAALHPGELVEALPREPHDVAVGAVVLPGEGLVRTGPGRSAEWEA